MVLKALQDVGRMGTSRAEEEGAQDKGFHSACFSLPHSA
jgi:hypothetical protein